MTCTIFSCPASSAVRDGMNSVPTIGGPPMHAPDPSAGPVRPCLPRPPPYMRRVVLTDYVRQKSEKTPTFEGARQLPLLFGGNRRDPTRHNLAALGHISLQELHVLVIDLRRIGAGKWT